MKDIMIIPLAGGKRHRGVLNGRSDRSHLLLSAKTVSQSKSCEANTSTLVFLEVTEMKRVSISLAVLVVVLQFFICDVWARPTTQNEAEKVVKGWLKASPQPLDVALGGQVTKIETYSDYWGNPIYYIVYLQPNGFVIVSGDDLIEPIIGFTGEDIYDPSPNNPLGALVTNDLNGRVQLVRAGQLVRTKAVTGVSPEPQSKWSKLLGLADAQEKEVGTLGIPNINDVRVASFVQTRWSQTTACSRACYNYYTPGPSGPNDTGNYPCGCVATALAQIMRYFQWPNTGIGTSSFSIKIINGIYSRSTRGGDGSGGAYSWADMVYVPGCSTTDAQRQAIGALCHDAGVGISNLISGEYINYYHNYPGIPAETTAYTHSAKIGLISTFKYGNAVFGYNGGSNIGDGLIGMVNPNLDAGLPVCFGIHGSGDIGHEVVCDGYGYNAGTMYHHINMGWAGSQDAWYDLPDINSSPSSYNSVYETIYNIYKLGSGEVISGRVTDPCGNPISDVNVNEMYLPGPSVVITHRTNTRGIYAFTGPASDTNLAVWADKTGYVFGGGQIVRTGHSSDSQPTSGNLWGVNFVCIAPDVNTMTPTSGPPGTYMKIQGAHFGTSTGTVIFPGVGYFGEILQWSDTVILCRVPWSPFSGDVKVRTSVGVDSAGVYFDVTNPTTIYVDVNHTPDIENGSISYPFSTIERGIYAATYQDAVIVKPGTYNENIALSDEGITLTSTDPNDANIVASTVIDGGGNGGVVTFNNDCSVLTGFTITNGYSEAGFGGGIFCNGQCEEAAPTISHCIITRNSAAAAGGGIYCYNSSPTIYNCFITGNWGSSSGGGIGCQNDLVWFYPTIDHCLVVGNMAISAGGIYFQGGTPTISHCDISSNMALDGSGGGIFCNDVNLIVEHSILWADWAADYGPEIFIIISENPSVVTIEYSDVQGGLAGISYPQGNPPYWDANDIDADPEFVRDPNPGPDGWWDGVNDDFGDLHLLVDSPCIEAGDPCYVPGLNETDMDGQPRVVGCRIDIGADEFVYLGDIEPDGDVDFADYASFAGYWQNTGCGECGGADLTGGGTVDIYDLAQLAENWLQTLCRD